MSTKRNLGTFDDFDALWAAYPAGGLSGDIVTVNGTEYHWDIVTNSWKTGSEAPSVTPTDTTAPTTVAYDVSELMSAVRVVLDNNMTSDVLAGLGDIDTLTLDEIIRSKLVEGVRTAEMNAPLALLGGGTTFFGQDISWYQQEGQGSGYIKLPDDFMRLIVFQMSDWLRPVYEAVSPTDPKYNMYRSRYPGVSGCPQKPAAVIINLPVGMALEFHSCIGGQGTFVKQAAYIPFPKIEEEKIAMPYQLKEAAIYYTAHLTAVTTQETELANRLLEICKTLLNNSPV